MPGKSSSTAPRTKTAAAAGKKQNTSAQQRKRNKKYRTAGKSSFISAAVFMLLGIILGVGYINDEGVIVKFLCNVFKGLVGFGYYLLPPAFIASAVILAFSKKKTAVFRTVCIMLMPFFLGCLFQLGKGADFVENGTNIKIFWNNGVSLSGGGVISGSIAALFKYLLSNVGAWILMILFTAADCVFALGVPLNAIFGKKPATKKEQKEKEEFYKDFRDELVYGSGEKKEKTATDVQNTRKNGAPPFENREASIKSRIDIPVDPPRMGEKKVKKFPSFFNKNTDVSTPAEYITGEKRKQPVSEEEIENVVNAESVAGFPYESDGEVACAAADETENADSQETAAEHKKVSETKDADEEYTEENFDQEVEKNAEKLKKEYTFPPISLLASGGGKGISSQSRDEIRATTQRLENIIKSFGINAEISNVVHGPTVTRYEMELEIGVKLNKLTNLSEDIALALGATGVRIAAIPNKISTVGIEVPNKNVNTVYLREIIDSDAFKKSESKLTFSIGKDISGEAIVGNIAKLPHLLVAGTTGSGKSVCLNSLILSILYKATPDEVKFIMIDPKMVEFKVYNGIPHLLVPVVTEAKKASGALQWAVTEMMKRYRLFSETGARDIASYNKLAEKLEDCEKIPQIVVIIDELADLMMIASKEVEESIVRIAQMGRAAGVHLVIATQSPRADVITGLMKANIPSRIAFKVASSLESRIILDSGGNADKLVGNGDMLFAPTGTKPYRIQGAWVTDEEREKIVEFVKKSGSAEYSEDIINEIDRNAEGKKAQTQPAAQEKESDVDDAFNQAVGVAVENGQISVSMLQRRLKLGYSRAARIVDQMEEKGIVGPFEGSKPRQVLISKQQWQEMQFVTGTAPAEKKPDLEPGQTMESADDLFND